MKISTALIKHYFTKAKLPFLEVKRKRSKAIESFKIIHDLIPRCLSDIVSFKKAKIKKFRNTKNENVFVWLNVF